MVPLLPPNPAHWPELVRALLPQVLVANGQHPQHWRVARRLEAMAQQVLRPRQPGPPPRAAELAEELLALEELHAYLALNDGCWNDTWYPDWLEVQRRLRLLMPAVMEALAH